MRIVVTNTLPNTSVYKALANQECSNLTRDLNKLWPNGYTDDRGPTEYVRNHTNAFNFHAFGYRVSMVQESQESSAQTTCFKTI